MHMVRVVPVVSTRVTRCGVVRQRIGMAIARNIVCVFGDPTSSSEDRENQQQSNWLGCLPTNQNTGSESYRAILQGYLK
jgi:hypothetical protein